MGKCSEGEEAIHDVRSVRHRQPWTMPVRMPIGVEQLKSRSDKHCTSKSYNKMTDEPAVDFTFQLFNISKLIKNSPIISII